VNKVFQNPIVIAFLGIGGLLFLFGLVLGFNLGALQLLLVPYTYDYSRGIGEVADRWVSGILLGLQVLVFAMTWSVPEVMNTTLRRVLWALGVLLVVVYFLLMMLAFISTVLH